MSIVQEKMYMEQVMIIAAGDEIVSERFSRDMFRFGMV